MEDNLNKVSSVIMKLGFNGILKINVVLYRKAFNKLESMYKEYEYYAEDHHRSMVSVQLNYDYFLSIENQYEDKEIGGKVFLSMRYGELYIFKTLIDTSIAWFTEERFNNLYFIKDGKLQINRSISTVYNVAINQSTTISTEPIVINDTYKGITTGIRLVFTSAGHSIDIDTDTLFGFKMFLDTCNPYIMAQNLVNFVSRPTPGTNRINMNPTQSQVNPRIINNFGKGISGRQIGNNKGDISQLE